MAGTWNSPSSYGLHGFLVAVWLLLTAQIAFGLEMTYCSGQNTGVDFLGNTSIYQSDGLCSGTTCTHWAFAIVQGEKCWCSNYAPADTVSTGDCSDSCPGYPGDTCGNESEDLYGYMAIASNSPSGTVAASSSAAATSSSSSSATSTAAPATEIVTVSGPGEVSTVFISPSSSTPSSSATPTPSTSSSVSTVVSSSSSSSWSPTPVTTVLTITGQVLTITTTAPEPTGATASSPKATSSNSGSDWTTSKVAGLSAGLVVLAIAVVSIIFLGWRRHKKMREERLAEEGSHHSPPNSGSRSASDNGLMAEKGLPQLRTSGFGSYNSANSPDGPSSPEAALWPGGRRSSNHMLVDQRLDPNIVFDHETASRPSFQDDRDYSRRVLKVANPDHEAEP